MEVLSDGPVFRVTGSTNSVVKQVRDTQDSECASLSRNISNQLDDCCKDRFQFDRIKRCLFCLPPSDEPSTQDASSTHDPASAPKSACLEESRL